MIDIVNKAKIGGIGASEMGKLFTKDGLKAKTAKTLILEKAIEVVTGQKKDITTIPMQHGIFNEEEAFYNVIKPFYPNAVLRSDDSIFIEDGLWVTPDVTDESEPFTADIKCPYTVASYWKNLNRLPQNYIVQNQTQMMGTGHKKGFVVLYLTSNRIDDYGNKIEYDIPLEDRHAYMPLEFDESYRVEIKARFEKFKIIRDIMAETLHDVTVVGDVEFFYINRDSKVTRLQDKSNPMAWDCDTLIKNGDTYYVTETK